MRRLSLRWKTILGVAGIEAVLLLLLVSLAMSQMRASNNEGLVKRAATVATLFATTSKDATLAYDLASLESFVNEVMKNPDLRYARVLSAGGDVLASAGIATGDVNDFVADQSIDSVIDGVYDASAVIEEGGARYGSVQIGIDTTRITSTLNDLTRWSYSIAALELGLVALFSFILGTYLTSQLAVLRRAARSVEQDTLDVAIPIKSLDEVGEVATAFNCMIDRLKESRREREQYERELESLNETLELKVRQRTRQLQDSLDSLGKAKADLEKESAERQKAEAEMRQAQKLEAVGHLAAGVAHEINTPVQFIGDSMFFVRDAVQDLRRYSSELREMALQNCDARDSHAIVERLESIEDELDIEYLTENAPDAIDRALKGVERVTEIVSAMKAFGTGRSTKRELACINQAIEQTIVVTRHQHRYCAQVSSDLQAGLPLTNCHISDVTQVFLSIVVNAVQAVADRYGEGDRGRVDIVSRYIGNDIVVTIADNGTGMPEEVRQKVFDPFFTTREVGGGSGQGLAVAYDTVVNGHGGSIRVASTVNEGATFVVRIPVERVEFRHYLQSEPSLLVAHE
ncbi:MAG: sensor histidine kinase [Burkholderiaceae bacterium]